MRPLLIIPLVFIIKLCQAQTFQYKAVQFACIRYQNQPLEPPEFKDLTNTSIRFNTDSSILYIYSPTVQVFRLDASSLVKGIKDSIITYNFQAIDRKGIKCTVRHEIYMSSTASHLGSFWLEYPDKVYMYFVEKG